MKKALFTITVISSTLFLAACAPSATEETVTQTTTIEPGSFLLSEAPGNAVPVAEIVKTGSPGDSVVVEGVIGGLLHPFTQGYASFVLGDDAIVYCNEMAEPDHCPTPWDACCVDSDILKASRLVIQMLDQQGMPLETDLKSSLSLKELDELIIVGEVAEGSTPSNVIINASGIYRKI